LFILFQLSCIERNEVIVLASVEEASREEQGKMELAQLVDRVDFIPSAHHHGHVEPQPAFVRVEHGQRDLYFMPDGINGYLHCLLLY
jgi:hypothetical protein